MEIRRALLSVPNPEALLYRRPEQTHTVASSQSEKVTCVLVLSARLLFDNRTPSGAESLSAPCHPPTDGKKKKKKIVNDFHLSCLVLCVFTVVSKGPYGVTLPHIPAVSLWLGPIHHPVYNYSIQLPLRLSR